MSLTIACFSGNTEKWKRISCNVRLCAPVNDVMPFRIYAKIAFGFLLRTEYAFCKPFLSTICQSTE